MGAHRDGRLCYLERRNHAIALALYRAAETTATRALRERAGRPLVRLVLVRSERRRRLCADASFHGECATLLGLERGSRSSSATCTHREITWSRWSSRSSGRGRRNDTSTSIDIGLRWESQSKKASRARPWSGPQDRGSACLL